MPDEKNGLNRHDLCVFSIPFFHCTKCLIQDPKIFSPSPGHHCRPIQEHTNNSTFTGLLCSSSRKKFATEYITTFPPINVRLKKWPEIDQSGGSSTACLL